MSYLVCEQCGKYYELEEGKTSYSYDKCECGGKLSYRNSLDRTATVIEPAVSKNKCEKCGAEIPPNTGICKNCGNPGDHLGVEQTSGLSLVGVAVGFGFLLLTTLVAVFALFGNNIPLKPDDIPYRILIIFGVIATIISIVSGLIASYIGGSTKFTDGIVNGGLVGVVLGVLVALTSGSVASIGVLVVFSFLSGMGGLVGTALKRRF
ncbi:MAG: zinc ribbon domain-containing protein [Methanobacterium sp.]|nr:zinc ribbon domain-containing protein [Methanobacterium sp.]